MTILDRSCQNPQIIGFDYGDLDVETRIVVQQKTGEIRERMKRTAQDIIEIGERLILVKTKIGHGRFGVWLKAEFGLTDQTARNFMNVAEAFKSQIILDLTFSPTALVALAGPSVPQEARDEAIASATNGQAITVAKAKEIVAKHQLPKPVRPRPQTRPSRPVEDDTPAYEDESQDVVTDEPPEDEIVGFNPNDLSPTPSQPVRTFTLRSDSNTDDESNAEKWTRIIQQYCFLSQSIERRGGISILAANWPPSQIADQEETCREVAELFATYAQQLRRLLP